MLPLHFRHFLAELLPLISTMMGETGTSRRFAPLENRQGLFKEEVQGGEGCEKRGWDDIGFFDICKYRTAFKNTSTYMVRGRNQRPFL